MSGQDEALRLAQEVGGEIDSLKAELRSIDNVLARRPALADFGTRWEKVEHACSTAGRATDQVTRLEAALTAAAERETKLLARVTELEHDLADANCIVHEQCDQKIQRGFDLSEAESALAAERQKVQALRECIQHNARDAKIILRWFDEHGLTPDPPRAEP